jgi:hypothetical protein
MCCQPFPNLIAEEQPVTREYAVESDARHPVWSLKHPQYVAVTGLVDPQHGSGIDSHGANDCGERSDNGSAGDDQDRDDRHAGIC